MVSEVKIAMVIGALILIIIFISLISCMRKRFLQGDLRPNNIEGLPMKVQVQVRDPLLEHEMNFWDQIPWELKVDYGKLQGHKNWIGAVVFMSGSVKISQDRTRQSVVDSLMAELKIMVKVEEFRQNVAINDHDNHQKYSQYVIQLLGCGLTPPETQWPFLVIEYADNGDLLKFLQQHRANIRERRRDTDKESSQALRLTDADLIKFSYQIAGGMAFLSSHSVVHRDLAARNVLISSDFTMKISDFGLSKDQGYYISARGKLPWKWMALESIADHKFTVYSDVWSFGITMWEIFTLGNTPYPTKRPEEVRQFLESDRRLDKPIYSKRNMFQIMLDCWDKTPHKRPTFDHLAEDLRKELESQKDSEQFLDINLERLDDSDSGLGESGLGQITPESARRSSITVPKTSPPPLSPRQMM